MCKSEEWERHPSMEGSSHFGFNCGKKTPEGLLIGWSIPQHTVLNTPEDQSPELTLNFGLLLLSKSPVLIVQEVSLPVK